MITFTQLGQYGRLGNQLFQYAILIAVGNEKNYEIKIPNYNNREWDGQKCLLDNFNISAKYLNDSDRIIHRYCESHGQACIYNQKVFNVEDNTDLFGYFQNWKYYEKYSNIIIKELTPNDENINRCNEILNKIKEKYSGYKIVSLHLRRGDVLNFNMYGKTQNLDLKSPWYKYFQDSKKYFENKKVKFLIFTGGNKEIGNNNNDDYVWCSNNLKGDEFIYHDYEKNTINDFTLMYLCDHHVIAMGSSLSWWVGFLNIKKDNKLIIAPKNYHVIQNAYDGFYPDKFIVV
jgi:hypothetical protein